MNLFIELKQVQLKIIYFFKIYLILHNLAHIPLQTVKIWQIVKLSFNFLILISKRHHSALTHWQDRCTKRVRSGVSVNALTACVENSRQAIAPWFAVPSHCVTIHLKSRENAVQCARKITLEVGVIAIINHEY